MGELLAAALAFPAVLFTSALVVAAGYWLLVLVGVAECDAYDGDLDTDAAGLGGVPVAVAVSLLVLFSWLVGLAGGVLMRRTGLDGLPHAVAAVGVLVLALLVAWRMARLAVRPLRRLFPGKPEPVLQGMAPEDFVGGTCVVRTGMAGLDFGQAEITSGDGANTLVQVRQAGEDILTAGSTALLSAYDEVGGFFWIVPCGMVRFTRGQAA